MLKINIVNFSNIINPSFTSRLQKKDIQLEWKNNEEWKMKNEKRSKYTGGGGVWAST